MILKEDFVLFLLLYFQGYDHNGPMVTHALGYMMYMITMHHVSKCMSCRRAISRLVITGRAHWLHIYRHIYICSSYFRGIWALCMSWITTSDKFIYIYICMHIYIYIYMHTYIYIYKFVRSGDSWHTECSNATEVRWAYIYVTIYM